MSIAVHADFPQTQFIWCQNNKSIKFTMAFQVASRGSASPRGGPNIGSEMLQKSFVSSLMCEEFIYEVKREV